jgi:uncharacterized protein YecE (DUF72 family)
MKGKGPAAVRVGPAGWSYEDWKGIVYPAGMPRSLHPLTFLCRFFDTIEVNSSFYRPPRASFCASWLGKAAENPRFKFTVKLWERFTHQRDTEFAAEDVRVFQEGIEPLVKEGKLGALLVQFPWSFKRTPGNRSWLARVVEAFAAYPVAIEIRHASWNRPEVYDAMAQRGLAFCNIDQPLFSGSLQPTGIVTAKVGYVRLHGRNHDDWFREDAGRDDRYNYLYSPEELRPWLEKIERIRQQADEVYVITNNHYRGQAVANAFEIEHGLGKTDFILPQHLVDEYPRLKALMLS